MLFQHDYYWTITFYTVKTSTSSSQRDILSILSVLRSFLVQQDCSRWQKEFDQCSSRREKCLWFSTYEISMRNPCIDELVIYLLASCCGLRGQALIYGPPQPDLACQSPRKDKGRRRLGSGWSRATRSRSPTTWLDPPFTEVVSQCVAGNQRIPGIRSSSCAARAESREISGKLYAAADVYPIPSRYRYPGYVHIMMS